MMTMVLKARRKILDLSSGRYTPQISREKKEVRSGLRVAKTSEEITDEKEP